MRSVSALLGRHFSLPSPPDHPSGPLDELADRVAAAGREVVIPLAHVKGEFWRDQADKSVNSTGELVVPQFERAGQTLVTRTR